MNQHATIKLLVQNILQRPMAYDWTVQGLGMFRVYLDKHTRLHLWDSRYAVSGVSELHTHPWHFESLIVAGKVKQHRYLVCPLFSHDVPGVMHYRQQNLHCGQGGGLCGQSVPIMLMQCYPEEYNEGSSYAQRADEIHSSHPEDGTVTLLKREFLEDEEHASVFWPDGQEWVSAEPRKATGLEVMDVTRQALHKWFVRNPNY